jgi:hypothetical protein
MEDNRTIGTNYYYSSLNYLGYSPYNEPCYGGLYETKPFPYLTQVSKILPREIAETVLSKILLESVL